MDSVLALHPAALGSIPGVPKNLSDFLMLPRLIDVAAAQSRGLITLIEPIQYFGQWQVGTTKKFDEDTKWERGYGDV